MAIIKEIITHSPEETEQIGFDVAELINKDPSLPSFIALYGDLGVGKTAFTRGFARFFGISGVKSPTYTVVNEYRGASRIFHFDMYRITDGDDLYSIGYDDYVETDGYCIAEWSENVEDFLPDDAIFVTISRVPENPDQRTIEWSLP